MVKSKLQKFTEIFEKNVTLLRLFEEFGIDFTPVQKELFDDVLFPNDDLIQEKTVLLLSENPEQEGSKEKTRITIASDNSGDLNDTWINVYTSENHYYIWFNVDSGGSEPSPPSLGGLAQTGIEIAITANESSTSIANKIATELESTNLFTASTSDTTRNIPAVSELTNIAFTDDTINGNANYSGNYFTIYNESTPYHVWFDVGDTSPVPSVSGDLIEVDINVGSTPADIAQLTAVAINDSSLFNAITYTDNIDIECLTPGSTNDVEENTASGVISANILRDGYDSYTDIVTNLTIENVYDGNVRNASNSTSNSPGFNFTVLVQGKDDEIATLNEAISTTLGLFPLYIEGPHEEHYRDYKSTSGTQYIYLLKWIYYTYKYFNEEQFFFQNLLEHYVPEYDSNVISSVTNLKIYFDGLGILLDTIDHKIDELYTLGNIDEIDESYLQHIAQLLGYQKEDFSIKNISFRELIKNLVEIYQRKGTTYSFELFFKLLGFSAELKEYYWDRDARNPEGFASITNYNYLYYLTTQNPATRTKAQYEILEDVHPIQPIRTKDWVIPKDLRVFEELQTQYSLNEILGFKGSDLPDEERFTYFKTNYINFQLTQFYTKQDLTAKDTDTILKYVKFLTPIYVSAFVEVVTTPWEDTFEWENILANDIIIEGDPGTPRWIDILLPFLFVTLKEYIPLSLEPAPEKAVVVTQHGSTDEDSNGFADSALPLVLGIPNHGITLEGDVAIGTSTVDLSYYKYINVKLDKGRGDKVSLQGNTIQTYQQLVNRLNYRLGVLGIDATALAYGVTPNIDIRIRSNTTGTSSKIYLANGLVDDLFMSLHLNLEDPVDGTLGTSGYQEFGLSLTSLSQATGLTPSKTYNFYINIDDDKFAEIDVSGTNPATTTLEQIIKSINNFYESKELLDFITSANVQYLNTEVLTSGKIAITFRDASTNNGKLIISNIDGTPYRSGINFSRFDCRNIAITPSVDSEVDKFFLSYYDTTTNQLKWSVVNNEGEKEINDRVLEDGTVQIKEVQAITLSNNKIVLIYTTASPGRGYFRMFDIETATELTSGTGPIEWYSIDINDIRACRNNDGFVVTGNVGSGSGYIIYFNENGEYLIGNDESLSTKTIASGAEISEAVPVKSEDDKIFIAYNSNNDGDPPTTPTDYRAYGVIFSDGSISNPSVITSSFVIENEDVDNVFANITTNNNIVISYIKSDRTAGYKIYDFEGNELRKETLLYNEFDVNGMDMTITESGDFITTLSTQSRGVFIRNRHLGEIASATFNGKVELKSILAGDTWDDNVENYAATSDQGHKFEIDDSEYIYDNYSNYLIGQGVDFTAERNRYNTFYETSPNDDLVPLIEDSLTFIFTLLVGTNTLPAGNVDKLGFYPSRNGYISRSLNPEVKGNDYKGYYLRHQDISENLRTDPYKVMSEIKWPQWKRDQFDEISEITEIEFSDDSINGNANYDGSYFIIYNGLTKLGVWYEIDAENPKLERTLMIRIPINSNDSSIDIANKTKNMLINHPATSFDVSSNANILEVKSLIEGETENFEYGTLTGLIDYEIKQEGQEDLEYSKWSSWSMAIDYFQPSINYNAGSATGGINITGKAYPAGVYEEFTYGVPDGVYAGAWQIDGDPTGTAIIEFTITSVDPSEVWPAGSKVSFIDDATGKWRYMDNTVISSDGKTISAVVDHFSVWGVIDSDTGELVSDDYTVDVDVQDGKVYSIKPITGGPSGFGTFGGSAIGGPYKEYVFISEGGGVTWGGAFSEETGFTFSAPTPTGGITTTVSSESTYIFFYAYLPTGKITIGGTPELYVDRVVTIIPSTILIGGIAETRFADYNFEAVGGIIITETATVTSYYPEYTTISYGWMIINGIAAYSRKVVYEYSSLGGIIVSSITADATIEYYVAVTAVAIILSGDAITESVREFVYDVIITSLITSGDVEPVLELLPEIETTAILINEIDTAFTLELLFTGQNGILFGLPTVVGYIELSYDTSGGITITGTGEYSSITGFQYTGGLLFDDSSDSDTIYDDGTNSIQSLYNILDIDIFNDYLFVGGSNSRLATYDLINNEWKNADGTGIGTGVYSNNIFGVDDIKIIRNYYGMVLFIGSNGKIANYHPNNGFTYPDGSGGGIQPYDDGTITGGIEIVGAGVVEEDKIVLLLSNSRILNYKIGYGWTYSDGTGVGLQPYNDGAHSGYGTSLNLLKGTIGEAEFLIFTGVNYISNWGTSIGWTYYDGTHTGVQAYDPYDNGTYCDFNIIRIEYFTDANGVQTVTVIGEGGEVANKKDDRDDIENPTVSQLWTDEYGNGYGVQPYAILPHTVNISLRVDVYSDIIITGGNGKTSSYHILDENWSFSDNSLAEEPRNDGTNMGSADVNSLVEIENDIYFFGDQARISLFQYAQLNGWINYDHNRGQHLISDGTNNVDDLILNFETFDGADTSGTVDIDYIEIIETTSGGLSTVHVGSVLVTIDAVDLLFEVYGTMFIAGSAVAEVNRIVETEGLVVTQSSAEHTIEIEREASGGITINGSSNTIMEFERDTSGVIVTGGTSNYTIEIEREASGGATTSGASAYQEFGL